MAGQKRLYLYWDPAIGADFQRQIDVIVNDQRGAMGAAQGVQG